MLIFYSVSRENKLEIKQIYSALIILLGHKVSSNICDFELYYSELLILCIIITDMNQVDRCISKLGLGTIPL